MVIEGTLVDERIRRLCSWQTKTASQLAPQLVETLSAHEEGDNVIVLLVDIFEKKLFENGAFSLIDQAVFGHHGHEEETFCQKVL